MDDALLRGSELGRSVSLFLMELVPTNCEMEEAGQTLRIEKPMGGIGVCREKEASELILYSLTGE